MAKRGIATFSDDVDSLDFTIASPEVVIRSVLYALQAKGKGIILLHDYQAATGKAALGLLNALKASGYRVVHLKSKATLATLPSADAASARELVQETPVRIELRTSFTLHKVSAKLPSGGNTLGS